jgi:hypothetical protein
VLFLSFVRIADGNRWIDRAELSFWGVPAAGR